MGSKTITISEEAYNALLKEKLKNESFSDVILRLTKRLDHIMGSFGKFQMNDDEYLEIEKDLKNLWESWKINI
ncbi:MAG: antitoxin VapB family protein [Candidatus Helarchaeota archaeon]